MESLKMNKRGFTALLFFLWFYSIYLFIPIIDWSLINGQICEVNEKEGKIELIVNTVWGDCKFSPDSKYIKKLDNGDYIISHNICIYNHLSYMHANKAFAFFLVHLSIVSCLSFFL